MTAQRRNPILWLVCGIPLLTLLGGYLTLRVAYQSGQSDEMPDEVSRTGQAQVTELAPDRAAAQAGLRVSIAIDRRAGRIQATQDAGHALTPQPIELQFVHPLHADADRTIQLLPTGNGWQATLPRLADGNWRLVLKDAGVHWRLVGRLPTHASLALLQPALPP